MAVIFRRMQHCDTSESSYVTSEYLVLVT